MRGLIVRRALVLLVIAARSSCDVATRPSICIGGTCGDPRDEPEPDGGLAALGTTGGIDQLMDKSGESDSEALRALLHLIELKERLGLSTEEFLALAMPQRDDAFLSDRLHEPKRFVVIWQRLPWNQHAPGDPTPAQASLHR